MDQVWTILSLKEYLETILEEREKQVYEKFISLDRAVTKAEVASDKRFESVNEFRGTLTDQQRTLIPRMEYEVAHMALIEKLEQLSKRIDKLENIKQSAAVIWAYVIGAGGFLTGIVALIIKFFE
jgi:hypothetical protein